MENFDRSRYDLAVVSHVALQDIDNYTQHDFDKMREFLTDIHSKSTGEPVIKQPTPAQLERAEEIKQQRKRDKDGRSA